MTSTLNSRSWTTERRRFVEAGGNTTYACGLGRMVGRVFALLYLTPEPLALEQIAESLAVSKASASIVVRQLAALHAIRRVWVPGDRRDFYEAETDFGVIFRDGLMPGVRKKLQSARAQIERMMEAEAASDVLEVSLSAAPDEATLTREQRAELRRRLKNARSLHSRIDRVLGSKLLSRFL
ncbi:MAG: hypothetical protein KDK99_01015 [Verrucomicrobiales bacterium]|nr:hypothetical protein [Verrucomicrobiales bacterium]